MNNKPITLEDLQKTLEAIDKLKPTIYINQNTYIQMTELTDSQQIKIVINNFLEDNCAVYMNESHRVKMSRPYY